MKANRETIYIDIKNIDTRSIKKQKMYLQEESYSSLKNVLKNILFENIAIEQKILDCRSHNTIFINGQRGSGKTQFILSIENYLKENSKKLSNKLYFFNPIDPTLLHDNESFLTIIIAKILNHLEFSNRLQELEENQKKSFYIILNNLSESIDGVVQNKNEKKSSLECISQDQTSLMLEQYIHHFFEMVTHIVNKKRLVLFIDDIDMAFDKGFEVLEVIRKYLSSPYIIPVVTGDLKLYEYIVTHELARKNKMERFMESDNEKVDDVFLKEKYRSLIYSTSMDYLIKVFPQDKRIKIKSLLEIAESKDIVFKYLDDKKLELKYKSILKAFEDDDIRQNENNYKDIKDTIFNIVNDKIFKSPYSSKKFIENLFSNSLRKILQYFHGEYNTIRKEHKIFKYNNVREIIDIEEKYRLVLLNDVETEKTYIREGLIYYRERNYEKAIEKFKRSIEIKETEEALNYVANSYNYIKKYYKAIEFYKKLIEIKPSNYNTYNNIGIIYDKLGNHSDAIKFFKLSLDRKDDNSFIYNNMGISYKKAKKYHDSIESFKKAIKLDSNNEKPYINLADLYVEIDEVDNAIKILLNLIERTKSVEAYQYISFLYAKNKNYIDSISILKNAIEIYVDNVLLLNNLGYLYIQVKNYEEAKKLLKKAIILDDIFFMPYINLMTINLLNNKYDQKMEKEFLSLFEENNEAMKLFKIFYILKAVKNNEDVEVDLNDWVIEYENINSEMYLSFDLFKEWAETQENKNNLLTCIETFEDNI